MTKKPKPPPALFGTLPEQYRPEVTSTESHTRSPCRACDGRGFFRGEDAHGAKVKNPCEACAGAGSVLTRISADA